MTCLLSCSAEEENTETMERTCFGVFRQNETCSLSCSVKEKKNKKGKKSCYGMIIMSNILKYFRK